MTDRMKYALSGAAAGAVNGLFGGGGGMVLAPALTGWCHMEQKRALATCVAAILPLCLLSAAISLWRQPLDWMQTLPYLLGDWAAASWEAACFRRYPTCGCGASSPAFCCTAA